MPAKKKTPTAKLFVNPEDDFDALFNADPWAHDRKHVVQQPIASRTTTIIHRKAIMVPGPTRISSEPHYNTKMRQKPQHSSCTIFFDYDMLVDSRSSYL
ncbi:unnamed protein product [Phytophthora lilii]|uniref:Unnamed protein product n=1 Tax=Phytophthora lilii TaxID=2077276 RepID=A0A9W6WYA2_9STRA|nr:unnamed protein product [Phytophthora lilii]